MSLNKFYTIQLQCHLVIYPIQIYQVSVIRQKPYLYLVQFIHIQICSKVIGIRICDYTERRHIHRDCRQNIIIIRLRYIYIVCREIYLYIDGPYLIEIYAVSPV